MSSAAAPALKILLTPEETRLAKLLVDCATWIDHNPAEVDRLRLKDEQGNWIGKLRGDEPVQLRIAGGWVRDKLLGVASSDIDVSTSPDPLTGLKFATLFEKYLELNGQRDIMGRLVKIEAKPEQSKHLETATAMIGSISVDWVQQRGGEIYDDNSRIPTGVTFGTPEEDADRRDLTINALFYNPHTHSIEDPTHKGIADLGLIPGQTPKIRTPLDPFSTFRDDPLRVVRAVRFAARFGERFELDQSLIEAIRREEIRNALKDGKKISRERVGVELEKMLLGKDPVLAIKLIERLDLYPLIFLYDPSTAFHLSSPTIPAPPPSPHSSITSSLLLTRLLSSSPFTPPLHPLLSFSLAEEDSLHTISATTRKRLYLSAALLPLYDIHTSEKKRPMWVGEKVVRDGIKWPTGDKVWTTKVREASFLIKEGVEKFAESRVEKDRVEIGLLLRHLSVQELPATRWNVSLFWSLIVEMVPIHNDPSALAALVTRYNAFVERILSFHLDELAFSPPLLDGSEINALLPETKGSPAMSFLLRLVIQFQLAHPLATKEHCRTFLKEEGAGEVQELLEAYRKPKKLKKAP